ncbi:MAG: hypothetical protein NC300_02375 [Bacteroidales bacterium]|nr:hypothetical protein [Clostridium sp.]MCM1202970.1 hypothetical protein [Bacteroidales bacterium]
MIVFARPITILMQAPVEAVQLTALYIKICGLARSFLVRLPMLYVMSIQSDASLTGIGLAGSVATVFGIVLCLIYYVKQKVRW